MAKAKAKRVRRKPPVGDPAPGFPYWYDRLPEIGPRLPWPGDPVPDIAVLLDRERLAAIRVKQLDLVIDQATKQLDLLILQRDMLKKQYKIR